MKIPPFLNRYSEMTMGMEPLLIFTKILSDWGFIWPVLVMYRYIGWFLNPKIHAVF